VNGNEIPDKFILKQNFPNPFNPGTIIDFSVPAAGKVEILLFDITGKKVAVLVNDEVTAGNYRYDFDGSKLAAGVYLYSLRSPGVNITRKMVLVK
jgi:hypothetical protein